MTEKGAVTFLLFITSGMTIWGLGLTGQPEAAITLFFAGFVLNAVFSIILFLSWFTSSFQGLFANPLIVLTYATSQGLLSVELPSLSSTSEAPNPASRASPSKHS